MLKRIQLLRIRIKVADRLRDLGYAEDDIAEVMGAVTWKVVETSAASVGINAIGDGTLIGIIIDFFKSPAGQALIDAIVRLLIGLLIGLDHEE